MISVGSTALSKRNSWRRSRYEDSFSNAISLESSLSNVMKADVGMVSSSNYSINS